MTCPGLAGRPYGVVQSNGPLIAGRGVLPTAAEPGRDRLQMRQADQRSEILRLQMAHVDQLDTLQGRCRREGREVPEALHRLQPDPPQLGRSVEVRQHFDLSQGLGAFV